MAEQTGELEELRKENARLRESIQTWRRSYELAIAEHPQRENDSKWKMFKNYLHNELGVTKDDLRMWIREAVNHQADSLVRQEFGKYESLDVLLKATIRRVLQASGYNRDRLDLEVKKLAAEQIMNNFHVSIKERE